MGDSPFLKEFYGSPAWSAKNVFSGYLGWFDGNPSTLKPFQKKEEAENFIKLVGGWDNLFEIAENSYMEGGFQWALQLTDHLLRLRPNDEKAELLRQSCLIALGNQESNPNSRYYYLSSAAQLDRDYQELIQKPKTLFPYKVFDIFHHKTQTVFFVSLFYTC